jgi:hypothetical protein
VSLKRRRKKEKEEEKNQKCYHEAEKGEWIQDEDWSRA